VDHTLVAGVVQVYKVRLPVRRQGRRIYSVTVVLAGNVAATSGQVKSRDVVCTVAILQLDSASTSGKGQKLVTQADAEDGNLRSLHQAAKVVSGVLAVGGVTGAVGNEDTIEVVSDLVDGVIEGEHRNASSAADQATQDVFLDTTVKDGNVTLRVGSAHVEGSLGADLTNKVNLFRIGESLILISIVLLTHCDTSKGGTLLAEVSDNGTSVDARDSRNTLAGTPFPKTLDSGPVRVLLRNVGNDDTSGLEIGRLKVFEKTMAVPLSGRNTVVSNQRLGENQNLAPVGGIGQRFWISDQRGGEDRLTGNGGTGTKGLSVEDRTISDREGCPFNGPLVPDSSHSASLVDRQGRWEGRRPGGDRLEKSAEYHFKYIGFVETWISKFVQETLQ
jgi:hypothetical protein